MSSDSCPICESGEVSRSGVLLRCRTCTHSFIRPVGFEASEAYEEGYAGFRGDDQFESAARAVMVERIFEVAPAAPRLLDVGCGNGASLRVARSLGASVMGFDMSEAAVSGCVKQGIEAQVGDFVTHDFQGRQFDVVTFWDVLEHLPEPRAFVERARELLAPGGIFFAKVPGNRGLTRWLSALHPRLASTLLQVPHHMQFFNEASLARALGEGFAGVQIWRQPRMRKLTAGGSLRRRVNRHVVAAIQNASGDLSVCVTARRSDGSSERTHSRT